MVDRVATLVCALFVSAVLPWDRPLSAQTPEAPSAPQAPAAAAPAPSDPNPGAFTLSGGVDFVSRYMFRGIRQHSTGIATWPWADLGVAAYSGDGALKSVNVNLGSWNSLHRGDTGTDGPSHKLWYESDFYATPGLGFGGGADSRFGFFSMAGIVTVPLGPTTKFGAWNLHGGAELQRLGDTTAFFNGGDRSRVIGSVGIGFSY